MLRWFIVVGYWLCLSRVLLVPDPFDIFKSADLLSRDFTIQSQSASLLIHLSVYFTLVLLIRWACLKSSATVFARILLIAVIHALLCEGLQVIVPDREPNAMDAIANLLGIYMGYWFPKHPFRLPSKSYGL